VWTKHKTLTRGPCWPWIANLKYIENISWILVYQNEHFNRNVSIGHGYLHIPLFCQSTDVQQDSLTGGQTNERFSLPLGGWAWKQHQHFPMFTSWFLRSCLKRWRQMHGRTDWCSVNCDHKSLPLSTVCSGELKSEAWAPLSYFKLRWPFCSADKNHLSKFCKGTPKYHSCKVSST
jgi:hypothetical protein